MSVLRYLSARLCVKIFVGVILALLVSSAIVGLRVDMSRWPELLGNGQAITSKVKEKASPNDFTFIVIGDIKSGTAMMEAMLDLIADDKPDFGIMLGDYIAHPEWNEHRLFAFEMSDYTKNTPMFVVPGNHDILEKDGFKTTDFERFYGPSEICFTLGDCLFVLLNNTRDIGRDESYLAYLEKSLKSNPSVKHRFVFMHSPPAGLDPSLSCNSPAGSERFFEIAQKYKIDYVFAGDHHGYFKGKRGPTTFIVSGGGGGKLRGTTGRFHHLIRMACKNGEITESIVITARKPETFKLSERNLFKYGWRAVSRSFLTRSIALLVFLAGTVYLLSGNKSKPKHDRVFRKAGDDGWRGQ